MDKIKLQKATLAIARLLENLSDDTLDAIAENESVLGTIINDNLGTQLRREVFFTDNEGMNSIDEDEVTSAIWNAKCEDYSEMGLLCRTELERDLVALHRKYSYAVDDAETNERRYRRAMNG